MPVNNPDYPAEYEEGVLVKSATKINFIGDVVTAAWDAVNNRVNVTITGGDGDVAGPASSTEDHIATFSDATGKVIKDSGITIGTPLAVNEQEIVGRKTGGNLDGLTAAEVVAIIQLSITALDSPSASEILLTPKASSAGAEGTIYYDSDDDHLYVVTA